MKHTKHKHFKLRSKPLILVVVLLGLVLTGIFYKTIYSFIFKPSQVALISSGDSSPLYCTSDLGQFNANRQCGDGMVKDVNYSCLSTGKNYAKTAAPNKCLDPISELVEAQKTCGETCINPSPSPSASPSSSYYMITNFANPTNITCTEGDINCGFYFPVIYKNITDQDLYESTYWTDTPGVEFPYANVVNQRVIITSPIFFEPGLGPNIMISAKVTSDMKPGLHVRRVYMDAKKCNHVGNTLDCYYGGSSGATTFTINLNIVPRGTATPTPSPRPSVASSAIPTPRPSVTSTSIPVPTTISTSSPVPTPKSVTAPKTSAKPTSCYSSCRSSGSSWFTCFRQCIAR